MSSTHDVQNTLASWVVPAGSRLLPCDYIVEEDGAVHGDTLGNLALMLNTLWALAVPPSPVWDIVTDSFSTTGSPGDRIGEYYIPTFAVADNVDQFKVRLEVTGQVTGGATVEILFSTPTDSDTFTFTDASYTAHQSGNVDIVCDGNPKLLTIDARISSGAGTGTIQSLRVDWQFPGTFLQSAPYSPTTFLPSSTSQLGDIDRPVSVERVRRLLNNAIELYERRAPGMVLSAWADASLGQFTLAGGGTADVIWRAIARQPANVTQLFVYLNGERSNAGTSSIQVLIDGQIETVSGFPFGSRLWQSTTITLPRHEAPEPLEHELRIVAPTSVALVGGACAWWLAADY